MFKNAFKTAATNYPLLHFHYYTGALIFLDPNNAANSSVNSSAIDITSGPTNFTTIMPNFTYCYTNTTGGTGGETYIDATGAPSPEADNPPMLP